MKRAAALLLALLVAGLMAGCASNTFTAPLTDKDGNIVKGADNKPVMISGDLTDSAMFHWAQNEALKQRKPIAELSFPNGGTMPKGAKLTVWGENGKAPVRQYEEPWKDPLGRAINMTPLGLAQYTMWRLADGGLRGDTNNYNGDVNANGSNVNMGRGTQVGGASWSTATGEGSSAGGGSSSTSYAPEDNSQDSNSLGLGFGQ